MDGHLGVKRKACPVMLNALMPTTDKGFLGKIQYIILNSIAPQLIAPSQSLPFQGQWLNQKSASGSVFRNRVCHPSCKTQLAMDNLLCLDASAASLDKSIHDYCSSLESLFHFWCVSGGLSFSPGRSGETILFKSFRFLFSPRRQGPLGIHLHFCDGPCQ